ncbi:MAG: L,D-transpeptidase/peptidoglycan binding protein [Lachnospiraceae bacterium]|nr:L,D-transpeptidase/peptidoglycan binding protein [Lachnospiraceae bacterium]
MKKKEKKKGKKPFVIAGIVILALAAGYVGGSTYYKDRFLPRTTVNGSNASGRDWITVQEQLLEELSNYKLEITGRKDIKDTITAEDIRMNFEFGSMIQDAQTAQNPWTWPAALVKGEDIVLESVLTYDESMLSQKIASLNCMDEKQAVPPADAYPSAYSETDGITIVPEEENNQLNGEVFSELVRKSLETLEPELTLEQLEEADAYNHPAVYRDNADLKSAVDQMNKMTKATFTYQFDNNTETLKGSDVAEWLTVDENFNVSVDEEKARDYVNSLARKYDTFNPSGSRSFKTSYGKTITIEGGDYGWWMNRGKTTDELIEAIRTGADADLKPVYKQTAAVYGDADYGDTYVEINLTAQHLFLYKNGQKILETDFVSGKPSIKNTPSGVYAITYKSRAHTMTGEDYRVETSYWMPFAGNVGMHDATWRSVFGGTVYKKSGSHGCINLPYKAARTIYQNVDTWSPVICYRLEGTEKSSTTSHPDSEIGIIGVEAIDRISGAKKGSAEYIKRVKWARQVYTDLTANQRKYVTNYQKLVEAENSL